MGMGFEARAAHPVQLKSEYPPGLSTTHDHIIARKKLLWEDNFI